MHPPLCRHSAIVYKQMRDDSLKQFLRTQTAFRRTSLLQLLLSDQHVDSKSAL